MKKQLIIIGIIILLLTVGSSGCIDTSIISGNVTPTHLLTYPNDYLGEVVTVKARYYSLGESIYDDSSPFNQLKLFIPENVDHSMLINKGQYWFKGILKRSIASESTFFEVSVIYTENPSGLLENTCCIISWIIIVIIIILLFALEEKLKEKK